MSDITIEQLFMLNQFSTSEFIYCKFLYANDIRLCNELVDLGYLNKCKPDESNVAMAYYLTDKGKELI